MKEQMTRCKLMHSGRWISPKRGQGRSSAFGM